MKPVMVTILLFPQVYLNFKKSYETISTIEKSKAMN